MRNGDEPRIRIVLGKEEAEGTVTNMKSKTVLNRRLAETEGRRILLGLHCLTIELDHGMVIDTRRAVFHVMSHAPQLAVELA